MKSLLEIINEKLYIKKNILKRSISELDNSFASFEELTDALNSYFDTEAEIKNKSQIFTLKDGNKAGVSVSEYVEFNLGDTLLKMGHYDFGVIFQIFIKTKYQWERKPKDITELSRHYLFNDPFLVWLKRYNVQNLCEIFKIKRD